MNVLHICANPKPAEESASKQLSFAFLSKLIELSPDAEVNNVDLYDDPPPYFSYEAFRSIWTPVYTPTYKPTAAETKAAAYADRHAEMFNAADVLVLTTPMWNFSLPAILKAWVDQVITPGRVFNFDTNEQGVKISPRHKIQRVILLVSSGGSYSEGDERDALTPAIRSVLSFVGITDITIAWADGQNPINFGDHEERKQTALDAAAEAAEDLVEDLGA
ncbi:MAG: NAD(P)H-dependent oxidoreductase [Kiritimatiellae bacterium]|nr:NAD(P)H-dependent oxidoreductase [Kiritimatiellia bacterium]